MNEKFIDSIDIDEWEIETDTGWKDISELHKTIKYKIYEITLENGETIKCAGKHVFFTNELKEIYAKDSLNSFLFTLNGKSKVISVIKTNNFENMYDITINSDNHRYFTNNILSHNSGKSTVLTITICHFIIFNQNKEVALLSKSGDQTKKLLGRIKLAYELLPMWLKHGVVEWNKTSIELENGSKVVAASTTSDSIRGDSTALLLIDECIVGDSEITIKDKETNKLQTTTIEELYNML